MADGIILIDSRERAECPNALHLCLLYCADRSPVWEETIHSSRNRLKHDGWREREYKSIHRGDQAFQPRKVTSQTSGAEKRQSGISGDGEKEWCPVTGEKHHCPNFQRDKSCMWKPFAGEPLGSHLLLSAGGDIEMVLFELGKQGQQKLARSRTVSPGIARLIPCLVVRSDQDILNISFNKDCIKTCVAHSFIYLFINLC